MSVGYRNQRGFAILTYVLGALVLIGIVTATQILSSNKSTLTDRKWALAGQIVAQANLIRQKILDCAAQSGNNGTSNHPAYPTGSSVNVSGLTCPVSGNPNVFSGMDGVFLPPAPTGFDAWLYTNDATNVRLLLKITNSADVATLTFAISKAVANFGVAASVVTTTVAGDTFQLVVTN